MRIGNQEHPPSLVFRRVKLPQLQTATYYYEDDVLASSGPPVMAWHWLFGRFLRIVAYLALLGLIVAVIGWVSQTKPEAPMDFSLRQVRSR